ncbi:SRPBCC family protein [Burkholderia sp. BCC1977]|uniref:SRPBCC family protein n=1 Tax=Burkholderia sp. BCC1977 TaxID=2817440 RepID=UPI002ABE9377|nr:SRPBCC family protein [Burkholderia sp. BCC1977]
MSIRFAHTIVVEQSPAEVFATLDDFSVTPQWLERCTGIEKAAPGPNAEGQALRYAYRDGRRAGVMDGRIVIRKPGERLVCVYEDRMMRVNVDFRIEAHDGGTRLTHEVEIAPRTWLARLFSPMVRRALPMQTVRAMESLRDYLRRAHAPQVGK